MFALWCFAKHNCISSIGMAIYRTRISAPVKPQCVSRFINFNIAKHPTPFPDHNPPNSTCSSNIKVNLQLYVSMRLYSFENPQPFLHERRSLIWGEGRPPPLQTGDWGDCILASFQGLASSTHKPLRALLFVRCLCPPLSARLLCAQLLIPIKDKIKR